MPTKPKQLALHHYLKKLAMSIFMRSNYRIKGTLYIMPSHNWSTGIIGDHQSGPTSHPSRAHHGSRAAATGRDK